MSRLEPQLNSVISVDCADNKFSVIRDIIARGEGLKLNSAVIIKIGTRVFGGVFGHGIMILDRFLSAVIQAFGVASGNFIMASHAQQGASAMSPFYNNSFGHG
ncbi:hypothetical protein [Sphingobium cupriresistens]|uniref:Uncharacterized protein n=1 Tax=Sphingobium cupriresistens LL01 TaxID=1420583 RepID=A0A0J7Y5V0_9SPHN|nr:hypothetical protein [Sphingobium cupriresistens]KMS58768.1 hypothetical protein V473_07055 [Sphingobium cupriresistens LL01]